MAIRVNEVSNLNPYQNIQQSKVAFKANEAPVDMEQKPDTFEKEGMSTGSKVAITVGSLLALLGAGFGIKKHLDIKAANKALKEAAQAVGIEDVNVYKQLKSVFGNVTRYPGEKLGYEEIVGRVNKLVDEGKIKTNEFELNICRNLDKNSEFFKQYGLKSEVSKNAIGLLIRNTEGEVVYQELILNKGISDSLNDRFITNDVYTQKCRKT